MTKFVRNMTLALVGIALVSASAVLTANAQNVPGPAPKAPVKLIDSDKDILGHKLRYANGAGARIESQIVTLQPGEKTPWHSHPVPTFGYILKGKVTIHYSTGEVRSVSEGEALLEAQFTPHMGVNNGAHPVEILVVYSGAAGLANSAVQK